MNRGGGSGVQQVSVNICESQDTALCVPPPTWRLDWTTPHMCTRGFPPKPNTSTRPRAAYSVLTVEQQQTRPPRWQTLPPPHLWPILATSRGCAACQAQRNKRWLAHHTWHRITLAGAVGVCICHCRRAISSQWHMCRLHTCCTGPRARRICSTTQAGMSPPPTSNHPQLSSNGV